MFPNLLYKFKTLFVLVCLILLGRFISKQAEIDIGDYPFLLLIRVEHRSTEVHSVFYLNGCLTSETWVLTVSKDLSQMPSGRLLNTSVEVFLGPKSFHSYKESRRKVVIIKTNLVNSDNNKIFPNLVLLRLNAPFPDSEDIWTVVFNVGMLSKETRVIGWAQDVKTNLTLELPMSSAVRVMAPRSCNRGKILVSYVFQTCTVALEILDDNWKFYPGALMVEDDILYAMLQQHTMPAAISLLIFVRMAIYVPWVQFEVLDPIPDEIFIETSYHDPNDDLLNPFWELVNSSYTPHTSIQERKSENIVKINAGSKQPITSIYLVFIFLIFNRYCLYFITNTDIFTV